MRRRRLIPVVGLCALALLAGATPGQAAPTGATVPTNWVHHAEAPWSWWSPPRWVDAHGVYDLNISSPTGAQWAKFGFSQALVLVPGGTPEQNAGAWFDYWAGRLRGTADLYGRGLAAMHYTSVSAIAEQPPTIPGYSDLFRIRLTYAGRAVDDTRIRGELVMDYVESAFGDIGIESYKARAAPRRTFDDNIGKLRKIHRFVTYTGSLT